MPSTCGCRNGTLAMAWRNRWKPACRPVVACAAAVVEAEGAVEVRVEPEIVEEQGDEDEQRGEEDGAKEEEVSPAKDCCGCRGSMVKIGAAASGMLPSAALPAAGADIKGMDAIRASSLVPVGGMMLSGWGGAAGAEGMIRRGWCEGQQGLRWSWRDSERAVWRLVLGVLLWMAALVGALVAGVLAARPPSTSSAVVSKSMPAAWLGARRRAELELDVG